MSNLSLGFLIGVVVGLLVGCKISYDYWSTHEIKPKPPRREKPYDNGLYGQSGSVGVPDGAVIIEHYDSAGKRILKGKTDE